MFSVIERLLSGVPPAVVRVLEARVICRVFAKALAVEAPSLRGLSAKEALGALQTFTAAQLEASVASGQAAQTRQQLGMRARRLGQLVRHLVPLSQQGRQHLVQWLYRGIQIELTGTIPGELCFGPCSFTRAYTPASCALMSAFDEGFMCGMMGLDGPLTFHCRLTEGAACCRASIT